MASVPPNFSVEAQLDSSYPAFRFNQRERRLLASVQAAYPQGIVAAGVVPTLAGSANQTITIAGALSSDVAIVTLAVKGATPRTILTAVAAAGQINVVMSGDPSTDHSLSYILVRAK